MRAIEQLSHIIPVTGDGSFNNFWVLFFDGVIFAENETRQIIISKCIAPLVEGWARPIWEKKYDSFSYDLTRVATTEEIVMLIAAKFINPGTIHTIINKQNLSSYDGDGIFVRDGIIIVTKTLEDNFEF